MAAILGPQEHIADGVCYSCFRAPRGRIQPLSQMGQDFQAHDRKWLEGLIATTLLLLRLLSSSPFLRDTDKLSIVTFDSEVKVARQGPLKSFDWEAFEETCAGGKDLQVHAHILC